MFVDKETIVYVSADGFIAQYIHLILSLRYIQIDFYYSLIIAYLNRLTICRKRYQSKIIKQF